MAIRKQQQGMVLVVALVFLAALTTLASVLMQNSTTDMKMAGASEEKMVATQDALSAVEKVVFNEVHKVDGNNDFSLETAAYPLPTENIGNDVKVDIDIANVDSIEVDCPRSSMASSVDLFKCNMLVLDVKKTYGRNKSQTIELRSGIAQQLLKIGN
ncbi:PilX N-terminal domain-containing pilus assembly protein [Thalassotalea aquiviva]|uniref:pilus assembly PilX family protein n=1 Tax=Thalassotalea aquiviva TaxID=3242415 RepID=UPI00352AF581